MTESKMYEYNKYDHFTLEELANHFYLPFDLMIEKLIMIDLLDSTTKTPTQYSLTNNYACHINSNEQKVKNPLSFFNLSTHLNTNIKPVNLIENKNIFFTNDSIAYILLKIGKDLDYNAARIVKIITQSEKYGFEKSEDNVVTLIFNTYKKNEQFSLKLIERINNENLLDEFLKHSFSKELNSIIRKIELEKILKINDDFKIGCNSKINKI